MDVIPVDAFVVLGVDSRAGSSAVAPGKITSSGDVDDPSCPQT